MGKCERPVWTGCLVILWLLIIPGILMTHIAIGKLVGPVQDLPSNIVKGFDQVFKFASLEADSKNIKDLSGQALGKCNIIASSLLCNNPPTSNLTQVDTKQEKDAVQATFASTLNTVTRVTNDIYFGTPDLKSTGDELTKIINEMSNIQDTMPCAAAVPAYCAVWISAGAIVDGMSSVNAGIDAFKNGKEIKDYEDNAGLFTFFHVLPYFAVVALVCFTFFHWKGGVCCCCSGGSKCACLVLLPYLLFWLVSFVLYIVIMAVGIVVKTQKGNVNVDMLNGSPTLEQAIDHVQTKFPEFWDTVFADMESALSTLFGAAFIFTIWNILIILFSMFECCCRPFKKEEDSKAGQ